MRKFLEVVNSNTQEVVRHIDVTHHPASVIKRLESEVVRNMSIGFDTRLVEVDSQDTVTFTE